MNERGVAPPFNADYCRRAPGPGGGKGDSPGGRARPPKADHRRGTRSASDAEGAGERRRRKKPKQPKRPPTAQRRKGEDRKGGGRGKPPSKTRTTARKGEPFQPSLSLWLFCGHSSAVMGYGFSCRFCGSRLCIEIVTQC